ncbi:MAG: chorismate synthase [Ruminococcaceae bacterium]|nr:chorismate synthase [Oscillospiraceae bacterium]
MKNTFGNNVSITLFGESHGEMIGAVIDGLAPGTAIDRELIEKKLTQRRPSGKISTARVERDAYSIVSGEYEGRATGAPLCILIPNENKRSSDYGTLARPGHADLTAEYKYGGYQDRRGGGHFSGRLTAPIVAAGAIMLSELNKKGIYIGTHIASLAEIEDRGFSDVVSDIKYLDTTDFPTLDANIGEKMKSQIEAAASEGDSVGGVLETYVYGVPTGLGEPWFDSVESLISHAMFSIPGIKGVEFGAGFGISKMRGSEANDPIYSEGAEIRTETNNAGGINGGITNGMPIVFRCAVRPTPSIFKSQRTVDIKTGENAVLDLKGRHDPAIIHRARAVVDCLTAIVIYDLLAGGKKE